MPEFNKEVSVKNVNALFQTVKGLTEKSFEQQIRIESLNNTICGLVQKITELETMLIIQKVKSVGHGATVK